MKTKLILFSDHPAAYSGLARITRDICLQVHHYLADEFEVCSLGYGAPGSAKLPFPQYQWQQRDDFLPLELPYVWKDFVGSDTGIVLTIGDIQRFLPLADTKFCVDKGFAEWMTEKRQSGKLKLWGYFPIDAHGLDGRLGPQLGHTLSHYDRRLVPSEWGAEIARRTLPGAEIDVIPHSIDTDIFQPRPRQEAREQIGLLLAPCMRWPQQEINVSADALWIGIVATNQARKDWALGIEVAAELKKSRPVFLWAHTDQLKREWSILELLSDYGLLQSSVVTTGNLSDEVMSWCYSACDITLGIGRGEGFGYPMAEAMACGTPVMTGSYGAQSDYVPTIMQIEPTALRIEGPLNLLRPLYDAKEWAKACIEWEGQRYDYSILPKEFEWKSVWKRFEKWFRAGVAR